MRRILPLLVVALAILGVALTRLDSATEPPPSDGRPPSATLYGQNLTLFPGDERALRIGVEPFGSSVQLLVRFEPRTAEVAVCPLESFDAPLPPRARCERDVRSGVREPITSRDMKALAIVLAGDDSVDAEIVMEYEEGKRAIAIAMPLVRAPAASADCRDEDCHPFFELRPTRAGAFTASARWNGPNASLVLLQGSVLAGAQRGTNIPYGVPARDSGASPLEIETRLTAPAEYALAVRHSGTGSNVPPLRNVVLEVSWP